MASSSTRSIAHLPGLELYQPSATSARVAISGIGILPENGSIPKLASASSVGLKPMVVPDQVGNRTNHVRRGMKWWEKTLEPNMFEIRSAQQLARSLLNSSDKLVVVDFFSPGCGGCRTLRPKICQLARLNPDVIFLNVNQEELRRMCDTLHIPVLPFFRIYRGPDGRLCSFSCTNATIKKFKDALSKHGTEKSSSGRAKGLDEKELLALASVGELRLNQLF